MKKHDIQKYLGWGLTAFLVIACSLIFYFCFDRIIGLRTFVRKVISILMPIIWGIVIAYLLTPIYNYLHRNLHPLCQKFASEKKALKYSGFFSILLSMLLAAALIYALFAMIVPQLISSIQNIIERIPLYVVEVRRWLRTTLENNPDVQKNVLEVYNTITNKGMDWVEEHLDISTMNASSIQEMFPSIWNIVTSVSSSLIRVVNFFKNFIIGFIVAIYLLSTKKVLCGQLKRVIYALFSKSTANNVIEQLRYAHKVMSGFISGKILDSIVIGVICFICTSILQIPYALLVSVIIGITNIIPFFGPFIGAIPCALLILLNAPFKCLVFIIFIVVLQQFDGNILGPKILGDSTGLSSFWVIFSLLLFGGLFGVVGMIIGIPVFAVFYHLVDQGTQSLLHKRGMSTKTKDYVLLDRVEGNDYIKLKDPAFKEDYRPEDNPIDRKKAQEQNTDSDTTDTKS